MEDRRTQKRRTGDKGELLAVEMLEKKGYCIVERNFACRIGEIDIIASHPMEKVLAFAEVKTRNRLDYGLPCEAVGKSKQRKLKLCAQLWLKIHPQYSKLQPRMDIIEVLFLGGNAYGRHLKNAF